MERAADVIVVGGGIIGLAAARAVARRTGRSVTLLEARDGLGLGSTAKATGGIRHQFSTTTNARLTQLSVPMYEELEAETGQSIGLRRNGYLLVTTRENTWAAMHESVAMQQSLGIPSRLVTPAEAAELFPHLAADDLLGGSFCPSDGSGNATDALQALRASAKGCGVTFQTGERVEAVLTRNGGVAGVRSTGGDYRANVVVNAAGPRAAELAATVDMVLPAKPFRRQVFVAAPIDWLPAGLPMLVDLDTGWYLHQEAAGTILLGGTDATSRPGMVEEVDWEAFDAVAEAATKRVPDIASAIRIQSAFCGIRTVTPDHHPIIGQAPTLSGYVSATACNGHGFMHAPAVGLLIAEAVAEGAPHTLPAERFAIDRFDGSEQAEAVIF